MKVLGKLPCPHCGRTALEGVLSPLVAAMELQAKRHAVEIECRCCGHRFVYRLPQNESAKG